jgi:hypothetical protein
MRAILQTGCQIQHTSLSLRYLNCCPGQIQCNCVSAYAGFNIRLNVSAVLLAIVGHIDERSTANFVPNTAHILQFPLCELWSRPNTKYLQLRIFRLQYSSVGIIAAFVYITTFQCALYCKLGAKYSAHPPVYAM